MIAGVQTVGSADASAIEAADVSVVVPCRNEADYIEVLLDSLAAQDLPPREVLIVDGGSSDGTLTLVERYAAAHPGFPLRVVSAHGANIAAALNAGIAATRCAVIVRMDAHARPSPDYLRRAVGALDETHAAIVGGVWTVSAVAESLVARGIAKAVMHPLGAGDAAYRIAAGRSSERRQVDTVPYGCFSKAHWGRIGGYNERLLVNEDYEFNYRTRQAGGVVVLDTSIRCEYFPRRTLLALAQQYFRYGWWKGRMLREHPRSIRIRQAIPAAFLPLVITVILAGILVPGVRLPAIAMAAFYLAVVAAGGLHAAAGEWALALPAAASFVTIHTSWSAGIVAFYLTGATETARRRPGGRRARAGIAGAQLALALVAITLAALAPSVIATRLHRGRLARAAADVSDIAGRIRAVVPAGERASGLVFVGPGRDPQVAPSARWADATRIVSSGSEWGTTLSADPWGNHYLIVMIAGGGVFSAGPNGILETSLQESTGPVPAGDDIGARVSGAATQ